MTSNNNRHVTASVILPAILNPRTSQRCLDVILSQKYDNFEVILLTDGKFKYSGKTGNGPAVISKNVKEPVSCRLKLLAEGLKYAGGEAVVWIDPGLIPLGESWLSELTAPLNNSAAGAVTGALKPPCGTAAGFGRLLDQAVTPEADHREKNLAEVDLLSLKCDAIKTVLLKELKLERIGAVPGPAENIELSLRIKEAGYKILFQPASEYFAINQDSGGGPGIRATLLSGISCGQADAFLARKWNVDWIHARIFMFAIFSLLLPAVAVFSIPYALIGAGLIFVSGWFFGFRIPPFPWEWPAALLNLGVYVILILSVRNEWATRLFEPQYWHPAIIRQLFFVLSIPISYMILTVAAGCRTGLKGAGALRHIRHLPGLIMFSSAWHLLSGLGFAAETFRPKYKKLEKNDDRKKGGK